MKKILSLFIATTSITACAKSETNKKKEESKKTETVTKSTFVAYPLNRVGYITELNDALKDNYFRKTLNDLQDEYKYKMDGTEDAAYRLKYSTTRAYSTDSPTEFKNALERLDQNNVGLIFLENKEHFRRLYDPKPNKTEYNLWKEIKENKIYQGYLAIIGKDSQYYRTKEDKIGTGKSKWEWKSDKIATFEYSEIISAYYMGYITQYTFGKTNSGTKKSVGYILGATYQQPKEREKSIKKAVAFRKGVEDAIKEHETGVAKFALKSQASKDKDLYTLVRKSTDLEEIIPNLVKSSNYKDQDNSFVYFAGASSEYNELIATFLKEQAVKNDEGHQLIGDFASTTAGDLFEASSDKNYMEATKTNDDGEDIKVKDKSVVGRIAMHYNSDGLAYRNSDYNHEVAAKIAIKDVLNSIYKKDNLDIYFGKHTQVGTFPIVYKPGQREVPKNMQPAKSISDELKRKLWDKKLSEDQFKTKSDWLGWSE